MSRCRSAEACAALQAVEEAIDAGAARVVLGTAAYRDVDFLDAVIAQYGERVVVSVDARDGQARRLRAGPSRPRFRSSR